MIQDILLSVDHIYAVIYFGFLLLNVCYIWQNGALSHFWLQEQARKALESALGGKKSEFEKWNKEIKRREEVGGGGDAGGGGWFGWGGRFGWSNGDNFWQEAKQTSLAVLGIILMVSSFLCKL